MPSNSVPVVDASPEYIRGLSPEQRDLLLGRKAMLEGDYFSERIFGEPSSYLPTRRALRSLFGQDGEATPEPPFDMGPEQMFGRTYSWYDSQLQFENSRGAVYRLVQEMAQYGLISCFTGDTKVSLLDGREVSLADLSVEYGDGSPFWVYSYDRSKGCMAPGLAHSPRRTGKSVPVYKVTLDNGESVRCTPEHLWLLRTGEYCRAAQLTPGTSLMPLYRKTDPHGYEKHCVGDRWYWTHVHVTRQMVGAYAPDLVVHHKSFDKLNNAPDQLQLLTSSEHSSLHGRVASGVMRRLWQDPKFRKKTRHVQRANMIHLNERLWKDPAFRARQQKRAARHARALMRELWATPEWRSKRLSVMRSPESKAKSGDRLRMLWKDRDFADKVKAIARINVKHMNAVRVPRRGQQHERYISGVTVETVSAVIREGIHAQIDVARALGCSTLTLQRRLRGFGTTFSALTKKLTGLDGHQRHMRSLQARGLAHVNHKVVSVELDGVADVYDLTVSKHHNFALSAGVFVHNSVLDAYAEDATQFDYDKGRVFWIESDNREIRDELTRMIDRVQLEDRAFSMARGLALFGDHFEQLVYSQGEGVLALRYVHPSRLTRIEDKYGKLRGFAVGLYEDSELTEEKIEKLKLSHPYEFLHFRRLGSRRFGAHGESMILGARRSWMQLKIMEDSMILYRLNRAPDRLVWYIDVGTQGPDDQRRTIEYWRQAYRKRMYLNTGTGILRQEWSPLTAEEDLFFPVPKGTNSRIEKLPGCFTGDTKIKLLSGKSATLEDLASSASKAEFYVYSCDSRGHIVPGRGHSPRITSR